MNPSYDLPFTIYLDGGDELRDALIKVCYAAESAHYRTGNPHESTDKAVEMLQYGIKYLQSFRPAPEIAPPDDGAPADAVDTTGDLDLRTPRRRPPPSPPRSPSLNPTFRPIFPPIPSTTSTQPPAATPILKTLPAPRNPS